MLSNIQYQQRLARAHVRFHEYGLDALVVAVSTDLEYLTGLRLKKSERPILFVLCASGEMRLICPAFERERIAAMNTDLTMVTYDEGENPYLPASSILADCHSIGLSERAWFGEYTGLRNALPPGATFVSAAPLLDSLRWRKEPAEIERIRFAITRWEEALTQTWAHLRTGLPTSQVCDWMREAVGGDFRASLSCTANAGAASALPHGGRSSTVKVGDVLLVDGGIACDGYRSDITRTYSLGSMSRQVRNIMSIVLEAQSAAIEAIRPGVSAGSIDAAAREVITHAGYGNVFPHRVGHGLGLDGHEPPYLVTGNDQVLEENMVITVEPGIYLPGQFGVRIEDDVLVTAAGGELLSRRVRTVDDLVLQPK